MRSPGEQLGPSDGQAYQEGGASRVVCFMPFLQIFVLEQRGGKWKNRARAEGEEPPPRLSGIRPPPSLYG